MTSSLTTPGYQHGGLEDLFAMAQGNPLDPRCEAFLFVRHGETDGNHRRIFQAAEQPLNERGLAQARAASAALQGHGLRRIVASTMLRAWRTAEIIGEPHQIVPDPEDGLRERWFGDLVGTSSTNHDWRHDPPNGESLWQFVMRTQDGIARALDGTNNGLTTLVAHGGVLYVLAPSLGVELSTPLLANATPLRFDREGRGWRVTMLADTGGHGDNVA